ncbi:MAG: DNA topoisomerase VI subunit B [Candidatus Thorarchaeota archaeon]|nr:DNA topoisomerase VI subunit B [Candidatus Thorarchaeota archaeon]
MNQDNSLRGEFSSISPAEFFYRNRQMAGFGNPSQAVYSTVRELVENSIDACEEARRQPDVRVSIDEERSGVVRVTVSDNGTGVPYDEVPNAFARVLYGDKFTARQRRGTFGLGVTMAALYGQITTDSPLIVVTQTNHATGRYYQLLIDIENNQPVILSDKSHEREGPGTEVTIRLKGDLNRSRERIYDYLQLTTVASPHARMEFTINGSSILKMGWWHQLLPTPTTPSKPHPHGADLELIRRLVADAGERSLHDFLVESFQRMGKRTATRFLKFLALNPRQAMNTLGREDISRLSSALRSFDGLGRPDGKCLSPIGKDAFLTSVESVFAPSALTYGSRGPTEWSGNAFIIEGVAAIGTGARAADVPALYRFANRVPLLYDSSEDTLTKMLKRVNWVQYGVGSTTPVSIFLHLCSTKIPFKAAGKQSIASLPEIEHEVLSLLRELGRSLKKTLKRGERSVRDAQKKREFDKAMKQVAQFSAELAERDVVPSTAELIRRLFEVDHHV